MTEWMPVVGYEERYEVSDQGAVRKISGAECGYFLNSDGYVLVRLSRPRRSWKVSRLAAKAFLPNPNNLPVVGGVLIWVAVLVALIGVGRIEAKACDKGVGFAGIGFVAESGPPVRAELIAIPNATDYVNDRSARYEGRSRPADPARKEQFPGPGRPSPDLSAHPILSLGNIALLTSRHPFRGYAEGGRVTEIMKAPDYAVFGRLQSRGGSQSDPCPLLDLKDSQLNFHSVREVFRPVGLAFGSLGLLPCGNGESARIATAGYYLNKSEDACKSQHHSDTSYSDCRVSSSPGGLIGGCLIFVLGFALMKLAFYVADAPYGAHWWGSRLLYVAIGACSVLCIWQSLNLVLGFIVSQKHLHSYWFSYYNNCMAVISAEMAVRAAIIQEFRSIGTAEES